MRSHILSRYEILGTLGRGGMGEVLKARDLQLKRLVAIKRLLSGSLGDAEAKGRFLREARLAAQLNHPGIATIYDIFEAEEETFIVMEYVEGETLRERVARGPLPLKEALALGRQIAAALSAAHHQGVIHRDIKSENIKVMSDGRAKVLDFGLAKQIPPMDSTMEETVQAESVWLTQQGFAGGTPGYTAPEQWKGAPADARADIFSFGVVLYEMITGETPFPGKTVVDRITATMYVDPAPVTRYANAPAQMEPVIRKALAKDPGQRFQSMDELLAALEQIEEATAVAPDESPSVVNSGATVIAGRYHPLTELGEGGMGRVYKARDAKLGRIVAIKELHREALGNETAKSRFLREASLLAQLNHPHIATLHDVIEEDGRIFIVMEYIEGERLLDRVQRGPLPPADVYRLALEASEALAYAHEHHVIHRDIKSANIMIGSNGHVKVLDFGLAKRMEPSEASGTGETQTMLVDLTVPRVTFGTPKYMSPEQRLTADVDERSDIFSLGVVLCEMLTGSLSIMGETVAEIIEHNPEAWPPPVDGIPELWRPVIGKCLARDPRRRYQTASELVDDLRAMKDLGLVPTEVATAVIERPAAPEEIEAPARMAPTLLVSGCGLGLAALFVSLAFRFGAQLMGVLCLLLALVAPGGMSLLQRLVRQRSESMRRWLHGVHPRVTSIMYLNVMVVFLSAFALFDFLGFQGLGDWRYVIHQEAVHPDIALVSIDEGIEEAFKPQGVVIRDAGDLWRLRQFHPQVLRHIAAGNPRAISIDLYFVDAHDEFDERLAETIADLWAEGVPVILGEYFDEEEQGFIPTTSTLARALPVDERGHPLTGHPIVLESEDGVVRVVPLMIVQEERTADRPVVSVRSYPSISLLMATRGVFTQRFRMTDGTLQAEGVTIPIDADIRHVKGLEERKYQYEYAHLIVNYPTDPHPFDRQTVSYADVWSGRVDPDYFEGKYVFIGSDARQFEPYKRIPLGTWSPYKIHASALNTILRRSYIRRLPREMGFFMVLLPSLILFALAVRWRARSWRVLVATGVTSVVLFAIAYLAFDAFRLWLDSSYAMLAAVGTGLTAYWRG
ncbi:MAG: CHASE2 domain-containing protein [Acidobacteria bacterium]|nr:MAG: CHASE2 domain-containing protein [Acidobacteriota bacterium]